MNYVFPKEAFFFAITLLFFFLGLYFSGEFTIILFQRNTTQTTFEKRYLNVNMFFFFYFIAVEVVVTLNCETKGIMPWNLLKFFAGRYSLSLFMK